MGCHTWFSRPITDEEFKKRKNMHQEKYIILQVIHKRILKMDYMIKVYIICNETYNEDIPCVYGCIGGNLGMEKES